MLDDDPVGRSDPYANLLTGFLNRDPEAREALPALIDDDLIAMTRSLAPDLIGPDLVKDVVQRMWEIVLSQRSGTFNPSRGSAMTYLRWQLRRAARDVRAQHPPPGRRTRAQPTGDGFAFPRVTLSLDDIIADDGEPIRRGDSVPCPRSQFELDALLDRLELGYLEESAKACTVTNVAVAVERMAAGDGIGAVADHLDVSRFTLRRELNRWLDEIGVVPQGS